MEPYAQPREELGRELNTDLKSGLTEEEASARLSREGPNKLAEAKKKSWLVRFLLQFKDVMIIILLVAAAVSFGIAVYEQDAEGYIEPVVILAIVVMNAVLSMVQESKAEKSLEALQKLSAPHARVIRGGEEMQVDSADLVPGDLVKLEAGDYVPADCRILESFSLKSEESALTGESVPSEKEAEAEVPEGAPLGDRKNMLYSGCSVTYGRAVAVVTATGMRTEMGKIAGLLRGEGDTGTPLQKKLAKLGKNLGIIALGICAVIFVLGLIRQQNPVEIFMIAVSLAVAAIPEGMPAIVTIVLAMGVQRMVRRNAIIRKLPAVETLGSASVICSDKTGTLTQNKMTLVKVWTEAGPSEALDGSVPAVNHLLTLASLCTDGEVVTGEDGTEKHLGDPTETALIKGAMNCGLPKDELEQKYPREAELPFDSDRKLMSTVHRMDGRLTVITKGAFDVMRTRCKAGPVEQAAAAVDQMSGEALRVLAVAVRTLDELPQPFESATVETDLTFVGLVGMIDPPREEAKAAVAVCKQAGIRPVMITGDHVVTASAIARQLGILTDGEDAVTGEELARMSEEELNERVRTISVYARVSPEDKIRIVKAWQAQGEIVSMTGDGVNDAPALKAADIGCAMGITGTDVAKGASDMILTDDNFATIVEAVKEGRGIYDNIKKAVTFLLGTNIGEIITVFVAMLLWNVTPLLSMQLLWINLLTDTFPALALGVEKVDDGIMQRKPKPKSEGLFANGLWVQIILQGVMFGALSLIAYQIGYHTGLNGMGLSEADAVSAGRTMAFLTLALSQVFHGFNMRSAKSLFRIGFFTNKYMNLAALGAVALLAVTALVPPVADIFGLILLQPLCYLWVFLLSLVPIVVLEIVKALKLARH